MEQRILAIIDNLELKDKIHITHGLKDLDELLSQLVPSVISWRKNPNNAKTEDLTNLINLQNSLGFNITNALLEVYLYLINDINIDIDLILTTNRLLQGLLLIHPDSRKIFNRLKNMRLVLSFLELPNNESESGKVLESDLSSKHVNIEITISFMSLLIHILLKSLKNFRVFEENEGCSIIIKKLKLTASLTNPQTNTGTNVPNKVLNQQDLNFKIIEFLIFYLIDESTSGITTDNDKIPTLSVKEKAEFFRPEFFGIDDLIDNLNDLKNL